MTFEDFLNEHRDEIESGSPTRLVVLLYDEAIHQLGLSIKAIKAGDIAARYNATVVAARVVETLHNTLDFARGADLAEQLGMVYRVILSRIPRINLYNDSEIAAQMIDLLEPLRDSFHALEQHRSVDAAAAARRAAEKIAAVA